MTPLYYKKAAGAIVVRLRRGTRHPPCVDSLAIRSAALRLVQVYDITSRTSFAALQSWVKELKDYGPEGVVICVCGNKADYESSRVSPHPRPPGGVDVYPRTRLLFAAGHNRGGAAFRPECWRPLL